MISYKKELELLKRSDRFRNRKIFKEKLIDMASNDYLGLSTNKKLFRKAYNEVIKEKYLSPKASMLVNGYSKLHKKFEDKLSKLNRFENGIVVGSGFLANISLIESMIRKKDILFIDEEYHASGILATNLVQGNVIVFKHNDYQDLENKLKEFNALNYRTMIAIEGVYSMGGDIAPKEFNDLANTYNSILLVDEAHSSGVIGKGLLGWYDYWGITPNQNHIKMGTLGKAYGSYGAYILASNEIISFLENRAKPIIYSTAPSLFDISLAYVNLKYIIKNKNKIIKRIKKNQKVIKKRLNIDVNSLIVPIEINSNKDVIDIQNYILEKGYIIGAIRQPTVKKAILRVIIKNDIKKKDLLKVINYLQNFRYNRKKL
ncbi:MAG: pyridoxal phosphate-dependent aminotransferase family protein [Campylobacterota bacterium]|nr:pyridoxal phosphate-dependent aminotransferase family protein [Campylobacterota bacterium]